MNIQIHITFSILRYYYKKKKVCAQLSLIIQLTQIQ